MNKLIKKAGTFGLMAVNAVMMFPITGMAAGTTATAGSTPDFNSVASPIVKLINNLLSPVLAIVGALGTVYCVFLGVKFAKAEEPQEREKAKAHLKNSIIGFVLIFVLMLALRLSIGPLTEWATGATS